MIFCKETPLIVYGAGEVGSLCAKRIREQDYCLSMILDGRKEGINIIPGETVVRLGMEELEKDKKEYVVIICLADGMQHEKVIHSLRQTGYRYFIFLPMGMAISRNVKRNLVEQYNHVISGELCHVQEVTEYEELLQTVYNVSDAVIKEEEQITVWMKDEALFTESLEHWDGDKEKVHGISDYQDINISAYVGYRNLFQFLKGESETCDLYFDGSKIKKSEEQKKDELKRREELNRVYEREYSFGMQFFTDAAPMVTWNHRGYWNLHGGHHRIIFLQQLGHTFFPVKMERSMFEMWRNDQVLSKVIDFINKNNIASTKTAIPHPSFYSFPAERENYGNTMMGSILRFLGKEEAQGMKVLDYSCMDGYFARMFKRLQAEKVTYLDEDEMRVTFVDLLNQLLYIEDVMCQKIADVAIPCEESFDAVFAIRREKLHLEKNSVYEALDLLSKKYLFVETLVSDKELRQSFMEKTSFSSYKMLYQEVFAGERIEVGVFLKGK